MASDKKDSVKTMRQRDKKVRKISDNSDNDADMQVGDSSNYSDYSDDSVAAENESETWLREIDVNEDVMDNSQDFLISESIAAEEDNAITQDVPSLALSRSNDTSTLSESKTPSTLEPKIKLSNF